MQRLELRPGSRLGESAVSGAQDLEVGPVALGRGHLWGLPCPSRVAGSSEALESDRPASKPQLHHLAAQRPWTSYFTSQSFMFFGCKMGIKVIVTSQGGHEGFSLVLVLCFCTQCLAQRRHSAPGSCSFPSATNTPTAGQPGTCPHPSAQGPSGKCVPSDPSDPQGCWRGDRLHGHPRPSLL